MSSFRDAIAGYISRTAKPVEKYGHQPRLYALTRLIGEGLTYDDDVVFAAAWLHDIGVFEGHRPADPAQLAVWDNTAYAMRIVPDLLREFAFPHEKTAAVVEAIRTHQPAGDPSTLEGEIVRDADILEQLGAIGVVRAICKIGRDTRFPTFTPAAEVLKRALATLPGAIRLESTRRLAQPKIETLRAFLAALDQEACPELF